MTNIADNPANGNEEWASRISQLSPVERANRTKAVDTLLSEPAGLNDVLETELWALRGLLQDCS